jgi:flagellar hook-length control protein FliK
MVDGSALAAIQKVLVGAGFEAAQVNNLLGDLKLNAGGDGVRVSTLFEGISRLTEPSGAKSKTAYLEISSLPHIETLLAKLGLTPDQVKTALNGAKVEGKGIDAERLSAELKQLQHRGGARKDISQQEDVDPGMILAMMQQIGLTIPISQTGPLDLDSLVASLQKFAGRDSSSLEYGASVMAGAKKSNQAVLTHPTQPQSQTISAAGGRLSLDQFAAELEAAAGPRNGAAAQLKPDGDWELFVRNIKPVSTGKTHTSEVMTGTFFPKNNTNSAEFFPGNDAAASQSEISNSLFSDLEFLKPVSEKNGFSIKGLDSQVKSARTTILTPVEGFESKADHSDPAFLQPASEKKSSLVKGLDSQIKSGRTTILTPAQRFETKADHSDPVFLQPASEKKSSLVKGLDSQVKSGRTTGLTPAQRFETKADYSDPVFLQPASEKKSSLVKGLDSQVKSGRTTGLTPAQRFETKADYSDPAFLHSASEKKSSLVKGLDSQVKSGRTTILTPAQRFETKADYSDPAFLQPASEKKSSLVKGLDSQVKSGRTTGLTPAERSDTSKAETLHQNNIVTTYSTVSQPVFSKGYLAESSVTGQSLAGLRTGQTAAMNPVGTKIGGAGEILAGMPSGENLGEAIAAAAAKPGEPGGGEAMVRPAKTVVKSNDLSVFALGDGAVRHAETTDSAPLSSPDRPAGRVFPQYLLDQVSRQILRSRLANESDIQIQLNPPSLGRLKMSIENTAEGLKVSIIAESQSARDMLMSNSGDLKTALMDQGVRLEKINVEIQADFNQTMADTRQGSEGFDGRRRFSGSNRIRVESEPTESEIIKASAAGTSMLNLVA